MVGGVEKIGSIIPPHSRNQVWLPEEKEKWARRSYSRRAEWTGSDAPWYKYKYRWILLV